MMFTEAQRDELTEKAEGGCAFSAAALAVLKEAERLGPMAIDLAERLTEEVARHGETYRQLRSAERELGYLRSVVGRAHLN